MITGKTSGILSEKAAVDLHNVLIEASQWIKNVTGKGIEPTNFRAELENGIILCELIERISPGSIRRINRMNIAMAHLDNLKQFLNGCEKYGLKDSQLFDVTDLQMQNTLRLKTGGIKHTTADRRLRNVCVTLYWLGRKVSQTPGYTGPQLNLEAFREILDLPVNPTTFYLQGYEATPPAPSSSTKTPQANTTSNHDNAPLSNQITSNESGTNRFSKQALVTSICELDIAPMTSPHRVEILTVQHPFNVTAPIKVTAPKETTPIRETTPINETTPPRGEDRDDLTPDELLATIQSAVDELLMDCKTSPSPQMKPELVSPTELVQRPERSFSSPSPSSLSTSSPTAQQPLPLFLDIKITPIPGVSLGLQLIGGADTAIPAQVEVVMPGKPAESSGLKPGDILISVQGEDITRLTHHQLIDFIKQTVTMGTTLSFGVERSVDMAVKSNIYEEERLVEEKNTLEDNSNRQLEEWAGLVNEGAGLEEEEESTTSSSTSSSCKDDEGWGGPQWQSPSNGGPSELSTQSSVNRLEEELEALNQLVTKTTVVTPTYNEPPPTSYETPDIVNKAPPTSNNFSPPTSRKSPPTTDITGIGLIIPNTIETVTMEIEEQLEQSVNYMENIGNGSGSGTNVSRDHAPNREEDVSAMLYRKEKWQQTTPSRQEADGKEAVTKVTPPTFSPLPPEEPEFDPFAPVTMTNSNSTHLLSDVLSVQKSDLKTSSTKATPTRLNSQATPTRPYQTTPSYPYHSTATPTFNSQRNTTSSASQHYHGNSVNNHAPSKPIFEPQDELQEMHGIKVRAVQHKRWTPEANRNPKQATPINHTPNTNHQSLNKKSSIYERRDVVLMEVRGRSWTQGSGQQQIGGGYSKQDYKRPWSGQPKRTHHTCSHCRGPIYQGPMMAIPDKNLYFHQKCLVCVVCRSSVSMNYGRATVFLRHSLPHCTSCYSNDNGIKVTTC